MKKNHQMTNRSNPRFGWFSIGLQTSAIVSLLAIFVSNQYFGTSALQSLFFMGADGWCDTASQGIGNHCFGDYAYLSNRVFESNPWENKQLPINYSASSLTLIGVPSVIGSIFGSWNVGLFTYLAGAFASLIIALRIFLKKSRMPASQAPAFWILGALFSFPVISAIDRGNNVIFLVLPLTMFIIGITSENPKMKFWGLVLATLVKPQFILLILIYLFQKDFRTLARVATWSFALNVSFYLFWIKSFPFNIIDSAYNAIKFSNFLPIESEWPNNISIAKFLYSLFPNVFSNQEYYYLAAATLGLSLVAMLYIRRRKNPALLSAASLCLIISILPGTSGNYYAVVVIPLAWAEVQKLWSLSDNLRPTLRKSLGDYFVWLAIYISFYWVVFPIASESTNLPQNSQLLIPAMWLTAIFLSQMFPKLFNFGIFSASPSTQSEFRSQNTPLK